MKNAKKFLIITSINPLNKITRAYASLKDWQLIIVGDRKGPKEIKDKRIIFLDIEKQKKLNFSFVKNCPENHYSRKNIGYLYAFSQGAEMIAESDDDNFPKKQWGKNIEFDQKKIEVIESDLGYYNILEQFTNKKIWPRGLPLDLINEQAKIKTRKEKREIGVWQFQADSNPDVDAIYRLTVGEEIFFKKRESFVLEKNTYAPFNTQNTFWNKKAFPLLYLPISVTFRFTDILRGYIAQRLFWQKNLYLAFGNATVTQFRNKHDLIKDFIDEIPVYTQIKNVVAALSKQKFSSNLSNDIIKVYTILYNIGVVQKHEIESIKSWSKDLKSLRIK